MPTATPQVGAQPLLLRVRRTGAGYVVDEQAEAPAGFITYPRVFPCVSAAMWFIDARYGARIWQMHDGEWYGIARRGEPTRPVCSAIVC